MAKSARTYNPFARDTGSVSAVALCSSRLPSRAAVPPTFGTPPTLPCKHGFQRRHASRWPSNANHINKRRHADRRCQRAEVVPKPLRFPDCHRHAPRPTRALHVTFAHSRPGWDRDHVRDRPFRMSAMHRNNPRGWLPTWASNPS